MRHVGDGPLKLEIRDLEAHASGVVYAAGTARARPEAQVSAPDAFVAQYNRDGSRRWIRFVETSRADRARVVSLTPEGSLYLGGSTEGTLSPSSEPVSDETDLFIARYSPEGRRQWLQTLASDASETLEDMATDGRGALYVVGDTRGALGARGSRDGADASIRDFFARYHPDGTRQWLDTQADPDIGAPESLAGLESGGVYAYLDGPLPDDTSDHNEETVRGSFEYLLARYDSQGTIQFHHHMRFGGKEIYDMISSPEGGVYAVGQLVDISEGIISVDPSTAHAGVIYHFDENRRPLQGSIQPGEETSQNIVFQEVTRSGRHIYVGLESNLDLVPDDDRSKTTDFLQVFREPTSSDNVWTAKGRRRPLGLGNAVEDDIEALAAARGALYMAGEADDEIFLMRIE